MDLSDAAAQSVKLNLANLTSADTTTIGSTDVHRLFVDGTSSDSVLFVGASASAKFIRHLAYGRPKENSLPYRVFHCKCC